MYEAAALGDAECFAMTVDAAYEHLDRMNWLDHPGPWKSALDHAFGSELSMRTLAQLVRMSGAFVVLDIETTGLDPLEEGITCLHYALFSFGRPVAEVRRLANPRVKPSEDAEKVTGLSEADLWRAPGFREAFADFAHMVEGLPLVVHHADFVLPFVKEECDRTGFACDPPWVVCTYDLAGMNPTFVPRDPRRLALELGIGPRNDAVTTGLLLRALIERFSPEHEQTRTAAQAPGEPERMRRLAKDYENWIWGQRHVVQTILESPDEETRMSGCRELADSILGQDLSPEVQWLGLEVLLLESSVAEEARVFAAMVEKAYGFLERQGWLDAPGLWGRALEWATGLELDTVTCARLVRMAN